MFVGDLLFDRELQLAGQHMPRVGFDFQMSAERGMRYQIRNSALGVLDGVAEWLGGLAIERDMEMHARGDRIA